MSSDRPLSQTLSVRKSKELSADKSKFKVVTHRLMSSIGIKRENDFETDPITSRGPIVSGINRNGEKKSAVSFNNEWGQTISSTMPNKRNSRRQRHEEETSSWYNDTQEQSQVFTNGNGPSPIANSTPSDSELDFGPFNEVIHDTVKNLLSTQKAIDSLGSALTKYSTDLQRVPGIRKKYENMEQQCRHKDERIRNHKITIDTLKEQDRDKIKEDQRKAAKLAEDRLVLEEEKRNFEKQAEAAEEKYKALQAELQQEQKETLSKLEAKLNEEHETKLEALKEDKKIWEQQQKDELNRLEGANNEAKKKIEELEEQLKLRGEELAKKKSDFEDVEAAKDKYKGKAKGLAEKLKNIESEFCLHGQTDEFYKDQFLKIYDVIRDISHKYFNTELSPESISNSRTIQEKLKRPDSCFHSVPISNSEDSRLLRTAHAQRVMTSALHKCIWQPFSSDRTFSDSASVSLLRELFLEISKNSQAGNSTGRAASLWKSLTIQALQSNSIHQPQNASLSPSRNRINKVVESVSSLLLPLLTTSEAQQFREDLRQLVQLAISVWATAEADELAFTITCTLNRENREEWRSQDFDPVPSLNNQETEEDSEIISATHTRIYTLFPRITAERISKVANTQNGLPGSWPASDQSESSHKLDVVYIHKGVGLPEWSRLVLKGKQEQADTEKALGEAQEMVLARRNLGRRFSSHSRSGSIAESPTAISPLSPSILWNGGNRSVIEE